MDKFTLRDATDETPTMTFNGGMNMRESCQEVTFDNEMLPEIDEWKVGGTYQLIIEVTMVSNRIPGSEEEPGEDSEKEARFQVNKVGAYNQEVDNYGQQVKDKLNLK